MLWKNGKKETLINFSFYVESLALLVFFIFLIGFLFLIITKIEK